MASNHIQVAFLIDTAQEMAEHLNVLRRRAITLSCLRILTQFSHLYGAQTFSVDTNDKNSSHEAATRLKLKWAFKLFNSTRHASKIDNRKFKSFKSKNFDHFQEELQKNFMLASCEAESQLLDTKRCRSPMKHYKSPMKHYKSPMKHYKSPMKRHLSAMKRYKSPMKRIKSASFQLAQSKPVACMNALMEVMSDLLWDQPDITSPRHLRRRMSLSASISDHQTKLSPPVALHNYVFLFTDCPLNEEAMWRFVGKRVRDPAIIVESFVTESLKKKFADAGIGLFWVDTTALNFQAKMMDAAILEHVDQGLGEMRGRVIPVEHVVEVEQTTGRGPGTTHETTGCAELHPGTVLPVSCVLRSYLRPAVSVSLELGCLYQRRGNGEHHMICQLRFSPLTQPLMLHDTTSPTTSTDLLTGTPTFPPPPETNSGVAAAYVVAGTIHQTLVAAEIACKQASARVCGRGEAREYQRILGDLWQRRSCLVLEVYREGKAMQLAVLSRLSRVAGVMVELDVFSSLAMERAMAWQGDHSGADNNAHDVREVISSMMEEGDTTTEAHTGVDNSHRRMDQGGDGHAARDRSAAKRETHRKKELARFIESHVSELARRRCNQPVQQAPHASGRLRMRCLETWYPPDYSCAMATVFDKLQQNCEKLDFLCDVEKNVLKRLQKSYREENRSLCDKAGVRQEPCGNTVSGASLTQRGPATTATTTTAGAPLNTTPFKRLRSTCSISARGESMVTRGLLIAGHRSHDDVRAGGEVGERTAATGGEVCVPEFDDVPSLTAYIHSQYTQCIVGSVTVEACVGCVVAAISLHMRRDQESRFVECTREFLDSELLMTGTKLLDKYADHNQPDEKTTQYKAQVQLRLQLLSLDDAVDSDPPESDVNAITTMLRCLVFICEPNFLSEYLSTLVDSYSSILPRTLTAIYDELMQPLPDVLASPSSSTVASVAPPSAQPLSSSSLHASSVQSPAYHRPARKQNIIQRSRSISCRQIVIQSKPKNRATKAKVTSIITRSAKKKKKEKSNGNTNEHIKNVKRNLFLSPKSKATTPKKTPNKRKCLTPKRIVKPPRAERVEETPGCKQQRSVTRVTMGDRATDFVQESPIKQCTTIAQGTEDTYKKRGMAVLRRSFYSSGPQTQSRNMEKYRQLAARIAGLPPSDSATDASLDSQIPTQLHSPDRQFFCSQLIGSPSPRRYNLRKTPSKTHAEVATPTLTPCKFVPDSPCYNSLTRRMLSPNARVTRAMADGKSPHKLSGHDTLVTGSPFKTPTKWVVEQVGDFSSSLESVRRRSRLFSPGKTGDVTSIPKTSLKLQTRAADSKPETDVPDALSDNLSRNDHAPKTPSAKSRRPKVESPRVTAALFTPPPKHPSCRKRKHASPSPDERHVCVTDGSCCGNNCAAQKPHPSRGTMRRLNWKIPAPSEEKDSPVDNIIHLFGLDSPRSDLQFAIPSLLSPTRDKAKVKLFAAKNAAEIRENPALNNEMSSRSNATREMGISAADSASNEVNVLPGKTSERTPPNTGRSARKPRTPEIDKWPRVKTRHETMFQGKVHDNAVPKSQPKPDGGETIQTSDIDGLFDSESIGDVFGFKASCAEQNMLPARTRASKRKRLSLSPQFIDSLQTHADDSQSSLGFETPRVIDETRNMHASSFTADRDDTNASGGLSAAAAYGRFSLLNSSVTEETSRGAATPTDTSETAKKYTPHITRRGLSALISSPIIYSGDKNAAGHGHATNHPGDRPIKSSLKLF